MNNKDMYRTFDDCELDYGYQAHDELDTSNWCDYDTSPVLCKYHATYTMDYEDTARFPFHICPDYADYKVEITVYNFRFEPVCYDECDVEDQHVYLTINSDISKNVLKRGIYYIGLKAVSKMPGADDVCTLINPVDCMLYVR